MIRERPEPDLGPWRSYQPDTDQNVYFGLLAEGDQPGLVLGLWTTDVCLSFGQPLDHAELTVSEAG